MALQGWPEGDRAWVARYRAVLSGGQVPAAARQAREAELLDAVLGSGVPAAELLGDARVAAAEDVAELATTEEAVRVSEGSSVRRTLRDVGAMLVSIGAAGSVLTFLRNGGSVDVDTGVVVVAVSVLVVFVAWIVVRALFAAGRTVAATGVLAVAGALALAGIALAADLGPGHIAVSGAPTALLALGMLAPGLVVLLIANRMPEPGLREDWDDTAWLRRLRGGLRARLVPASTTRAHTTEIEQTIASGTASAFEEFGHPLVLARELAESDPRSRSRRWWVLVVAGTGIPLVVAALVLTGGWGVLTVPVVVLLLLGAVLTPAVGWRDRPWRGIR